MGSATACCSSADRADGQLGAARTVSAPLDAYVSEEDGSEGQNGQVVQVFPDQSKYEGQCKKGQKDGKGKFTYPDGAVYDGEWKANRASGTGVYDSKQSKYTGEWQSDLKHGQAVEVW